MTHHSWDSHFNTHILQQTFIQSLHQAPRKLRQAEAPPWQKPPPSGEMTPHSQDTVSGRQVSSTHQARGHGDVPRESSDTTRGQAAEGRTLAVPTEGPCVWFSTAQRRSPSREQRAWLLWTGAVVHHSTSEGQENPARLLLQKDHLAAAQGWPIRTFCWTQKNCHIQQHY